MSLRKILSYFNAGICQISAPELIAIGLNVATFILFGSLLQSAYLWIIIIICDLCVLGSHGTWVIYGGDPVHGPWRTPAPLTARCIASVNLFIMMAEDSTDAILGTFSWYVATIAAICWAFYCILLAMHQKNPTWLEGTHGRIGAPNWISIMRIALSILVPHLYAVQPFGASSNVIATIILALAIATDAADGYIARRLNQMTKAGKALDPLGDKVIFYPTAIAFILATSGTALLDVSWMRLAFYIGLGIMFLRDVLFVVWFFLYYTKLSSGIGAGMVDKTRMAIMCVWLGTAALALTFPMLQSHMAIAGFICMCVIAILSITSVAVDYLRIRDLIRPPAKPYVGPDIYEDEE